MKLALPALAVLAAASWWAAAAPASHADTVILKNGSVIHGDARTQDGRVVIDFGTPGRMTLPSDRVVRIEDDDTNAFARNRTRPAPAAEGRPVIVTLKEDAGSGGRGPYIGTTTSSPDDRVLVLRIGTTGEVRILRERIQEIEEVPAEDLPPAPSPEDEAEAADVEEPAEPEAAEEAEEAEAAEEAEGAEEPERRAIPTTHKITLRDGRVIRADVVADVEGEPLEIALGKLGAMTIPRSRIESVEEEEGEYLLPLPAPEPERVSEPEPSPQRIEELRDAFREELIRELLRDYLERRIDQAIRRGALDLSLQELRDRVPVAEARKLRDLAYELTRWRNQNRVRAERKLKAYGPDALPFIRPLVNDPFELTRRAVQRIVRAVGDLRGAQIAIRGLTDEDIWVRRLAYQAAREILRERVRYDPGAGPAHWERAARRYAEIYEQAQREYLLAQLGG